MNAYDRDRCNRPCTKVARNCRYVLSGLLLGSFQPSLQSFFLGCGSSAVKIHQKIKVMLIIRSEEKKHRSNAFEKKFDSLWFEVEYWAIPDRKVKGCLELPQIAFKVSGSIQSLDNKHAGSDWESISNCWSRWNRKLSTLSFIWKKVAVCWWTGDYNKRFSWAEWVFAVSVFVFLLVCSFVKPLGSLYWANQSLSWFFLLWKWQTESLWLKIHRHKICQFFKVVLIVRCVSVKPCTHQQKEN